MLPLSNIKILLLVGGLSLASCGASLAASESASPKAFEPKNPRIQAQLDRLRQRRLLPDPKTRPLVISEKASSRKDWLDKVLAHGYATSGHTNANWDARVRAAFAAYSSYSRASKWDQYKPMVDAISAAIKAGCDDPLILYMDCRYRLADLRPSDEELALAYLRANEAMLDSHYHPVLKFFVGYRAVQGARTADVGGNRSPLINFVTVSLEDLARDANAPSGEVFEAAEMWVSYTREKSWLDFILHDLLPLIEKNWGREEHFFRLTGLVEIERAWGQRGGGYADTVTDKGWEGFTEHLNKAEPPLKAAWQMNSNIAQTAYLMMRLELGQGRGRPVMETWFRRAMALETNYYDAALLMAFYLEPRWYGSREDTLKFGRECVASTNWGGQVPLVLRQTHHSLARFYKMADSPEYWHKPEVWQDVKASFERFFALNPDAVGWRHDYARDAYLCGHYGEFLQQTKLFSAGTNFAFFGGEQKFREMLAKASEKAQKP